MTPPESTPSRHLDLVAALLAAAWALTIWAQPEDPHQLALAMARLCSPEMASGFAVAAATRWYGHVHKLAAVLLVGCTSIPVQPVAPEDEELVEIAASDLGYGVRWAQHGIEVDVLDEPTDEHLGKAQRGICRRHIESIRDTAVLRHEIGHALGLSHSGDNDNVMFTRVGGDTTELTRDQRERMDAELAFLLACERAAKAAAKRKAEQ